jgi:hypothetical protein
MSVKRLVADDLSPARRQVPTRRVSDASSRRASASNITVALAGILTGGPIFPHNATPRHNPATHHPGKPRDISPVTVQRIIGCTHFKTTEPECNCWNLPTHLASRAVARRHHGENSIRETGTENIMTRKAGKLTTFAVATTLTTLLAGSAMAQTVNANVGVNANVAANAAVGVNAGAGAGAATGGLGGLVSGLLGDVTGLLGGLGLGGIL